MKCQACSFDDEQQPARAAWEREEAFIEIKGCFVRTSVWPMTIEGIEIYACPKCGTLRIEL